MEEKKEKTNIIIAENNRSYAELLAEAIDRTDDFTIAESANNANTLMQKLNKLRNGIILLDIHMPPYMDGLECAQKIFEHHPKKFKIIFLSVLWNDKISKLISDKKVNGYISKNVSIYEILDTLAKVRDGETIVLRGGKFAEDVTDLPENDIAKKHGLTAREQVVLCKMVKGLNTKGIAAEMNIEAGTVETHIKNMKNKTKLNTRRLIAFAIHNKICE